MERTSVILGHLRKQNYNKLNVTKATCSTSFDDPDVLSVIQDLKKIGVCNVEISGPPVNYEIPYRFLLTPGAVKFVAGLVQQFDKDVDQILSRRQQVKLDLDSSGHLPNFPQNSTCRSDSKWRVSPVPRRLQCRHVDLGDVSPSNTSHFIAALKSSAQGIQTDFDDGHCPTWRNQLRGLHNVYKAVHNQIDDVPEISQAPVLMLRPRAWNMVEHNMLVDGKEVPGPLFDFGLLMYHNASILLETESGPYFYLSKLEGSNEAKLWDNIFTWTENKLGLPHGCTKACVLIENVLASFEMEEILYALRDHSNGLNCGIWDYSASFVNKFGHRRDFILPDRNKYVSMDRHFLKSYMDLVVKTCHARGCHATGGMAALLLLPSKEHADYQTIKEKVISGKRKEIEAGVDGFMVYDIRLVEPMQQMFRDMTKGPNQWSVMKANVIISPEDLLKMPSGSVTLAGLRHNILVGILFIESWLRGQGHYYLKGAVEDSATAEISRSQVWQWIRHRARIEDNNDIVTMTTVERLANHVVDEKFWTEMSFTPFKTAEDKVRLQTAMYMFLEIVTKRDFPEFITTYLNLHHTFLKAQGAVVNTQT